MTDDPTPSPRPLSPLRRWIRRGFIAWAVISTAYLANTMRTRGVDPLTLQSSASVSVVDGAATLAFMPVGGTATTALIFICGSGVTAEAYAPMLRPIAEAGYQVHVVRLPYRFAPFESHRAAAVARARAVMAAHPAVTQWVLSGHSLGGAMAARLARDDARSLAALVLIGTTHPKEDDLSALHIPVTKVYASKDGVAPKARVLANRHLLPTHTKWVEIAGGNHSQFGRYGHQLFDGTAAIGREEQEAAARAELMGALRGAASR